MRLSVVFRWRGKVRYWDARDQRRGGPRQKRGKRNHKLHVRTETYDKLVSIARSRGLAIQATVDLIMAGALR